MVTREVGSAPDPSEANVLDLMAGWPQRDHPSQALDTRSLVVLPNLMALDRMPWTSSTTNFATTPRVLIDPPTNPIPVLRRNPISHI